MTETPFALVDELAGVLDGLGIPYAVGGSLASSTFGTPRSTHDVDVLVGLTEATLEPLAHALREAWYVPVDAARRALDAHGAFNVLHLGTGLKVDLFVAGPGPLDAAQLATAVEVRLADGGRAVRVTAPAVLVVRKLAWFRAGGEVSERQWRDVLGVLAQQGPGIAAAARELAEGAGVGVGDLLSRALDEVAAQGD